MLRALTFGAVLGGQLEEGHIVGYMCKNFDGRVKYFERIFAEIKFVNNKFDLL